MDCVYISATHVSSLIVQTDEDGNPIELGGVATSQMGKVSVKDDKEAQRHIDAGYALPWSDDLEDKANEQAEAKKRETAEQEKAAAEQDKVDKENRAVEGILNSITSDGVQDSEDETPGETETSE